MTTIVAVRTDEHVVIGSDSMLTQGETRVTHTHCVTTKLYTVADSCIGLSGTAAHYTSLVRALREMGGACELHGYDAVFDTFTRVHKKLKDEYFLNPKRQVDDAYEANHISAMVANSSGIYGVYAHREVLVYENYWSNGSGRAYALGAMRQSWLSQSRRRKSSGPDALEVARAGLAAGMEFDRDSGGAMCLYRFVTGTRSAAELVSHPGAVLNLPRHMTA